MTLKFEFSLKNFYTMFKVFKRSLITGKGIWSDFSKRSESLKLQSEIPISPSSYYAPLLIDETFQQAYKILEDDSEEIYSKITQETDINKKEELLIKAEIHNPQVQFNMAFNQDKLDITQPVYRKFLQQTWKDYDLMVLMQRLEQFKVIPDTLPTLDPKVDVKIRFSHTTNSEFNRWITPGEILPAFLVNQPPVIKITQFDNLTPDHKSLFTIVLVNPDEPNLRTNQFNTTLNYGVANVALSLTDDTFSIAKQLNAKEFNTFKSYVPLLPEVNAGNYQRACLWVFKQQDDQPLTIDQALYDTKHFDIRAFANNNNLTPVGAHMWRQKYDRSVNDVRQQYNLPKGRVFHRIRRPHPAI